MAFNLQGGYGAGAGADMLQQILRQKAQEFAQAEATRVADERTKQEAARIAQEGERLKGDAQMRQLTLQSLNQDRAFKQDEATQKDAERQAAAAKASTLGTLRGAIAGSQNLAGTSDPTGAAATRGALRVAMASGGAEPKDIPQEAKPETTPVMRVNPRTGMLENIGSAPTGAHFVTEPPPPTAPAGAAPQVFYDTKNQPHALRYENGGYSEVPLPPGITGKAPPSAAALMKEDERKNALAGLDQLDTAISAAEPFIGPGQGRVSTIEQMVGNPDPSLAALGTKMLMAKMTIDKSIGGARAAASPKLLERWDNLFSTKMTPEALRATVAAMREMTNAGQTGPPAADDPYAAYLARKKKK
jgi:hypothetical protein